MSEEKEKGKVVQLKPDNYSNVDISHIPNANKFSLFAQNNNNQALHFNTLYRLAIIEGGAVDEHGIIRVERLDEEDIGKKVAEVFEGKVKDYIIKRHKIDENDEIAMDAFMQHYVGKYSGELRQTIMMEGREYTPDRFNREIQNHYFRQQQQMIRKYFTDVSTEQLEKATGSKLRDIGPEEKAMLAARVATQYDPENLASIVNRYKKSEAENYKKAA